MIVDPALRKGRPSIDDLAMHLLLLYLMPYTVHCDHGLERAEFERRASRERAARLLAGIPTQRLPHRADLHRRAR